MSDDLNGELHSAAFWGDLQRAKTALKDGADVNADVRGRIILQTAIGQGHLSLVRLLLGNGAGSFGRQKDGVALQSASHNMADPRYRNCTTCHVRIHGSNADRTFLR